MISISNSFKTALNTYGKQINVRITYNGVEYTKRDMVSVGLHYDGTLLKSNMRCLDIETNIEIPKGAILDKVEFGVRASTKDAYEYINFGKYEVYDSEYQVDTHSYKLTCYDSMLKSMIPYDLTVTYPITVLDFLKAICDRLGWTLGSENFINSDKEITEEMFDNGFTFRDVLDNISQVGACSLGFRNDDKLYPLVPNETGVIITESNLKSLKVGKHYAINSLVLARVPQEDNIYRPIEAVENRQEIRIENNAIMDDNRDDYIDSIFNQLNGLEFSCYEFESTGICYLEFLDRFTIKTKDGKEYTTLMLSDDIQITQGLVEKAFIKEVEASKTDYDKASTTDRLLNKTLLEVDKQNQTITALITKTNTTNEVVESLGESLNAVTSEVTSTVTTQVKAEAGLIRQEISESYATKSELSNEVNTITSKVESTASSVTTKFYEENIKTPLGNVADGLSEEITKREAIIRQTMENGQPVIELGASESPVNTKYKNDGMYIYENGEVVAYFKNNKAYNTDLEVLNSFKLGNFAFIPRKNGNLSLVKVSEVSE